MSWRHIWSVLVFAAGAVGFGNSACAAADDPYDAYPSDTFASCGTVTETGERLIHPGEGCTFIIRAYKQYERKLKYWVVFRPAGSSTFQRVSRTRTFRNQSRWGFETLKVPSQGTGTFCVLFDENNNGYPDAAKGDFSIVEVPLRVLE